MKKKLIIGLLCLCLAGSAVACKKESDSKTPDTQQGVSINNANVELGEYKGVEVTMLSTEVTDEEVQKALESFVTGTKLEITDRKDVQTGDITNIDYAGKIDGEAFNGGTAQGTDLTIGSNSFIAGFEEQLVGHTVGETFDINVTFPKDYREEGTAGSEVNGKDAVFTITINALKRNATMDDLTDEFIVKHTESTGKYNSIEEWKTAKKQELKTQKEDQAELKFKSDAIQAVIDNSEFKDDLSNQIKTIETNMKNYYQSIASAWGLEFPTFLSLFMGMTEEQFNTEIANSSEFYVKQEIIGNKIVKEENLVLSDEEYTTGLAQLANEAQAETPEAYETENGKEIIQQQLLLNKAYQLIFDNAVKK